MRWPQGGRSSPAPRSRRSYTSSSDSSVSLLLLPPSHLEAAPAPRPAWTLPGSGKILQGGGPGGLGHSLPPPPPLPPTPCHPRPWPLTLPNPSHLPRDPHGRDVARGHGPVRVPSLQLPPVPPTAAPQPCSQVACPPRSCLLWSSQSLGEAALGPTTPPQACTSSFLPQVGP